MSVGLFAGTITTGIAGINLALGGENAATINAYNQAYSISYRASAQRAGALNAKTTAEHNIAAINQDKILSNMDIQLKQQDAEASAQVSAAVAGVEGSSVDSGLYQIDSNASMRAAQVQAKSDQLTEQQLAQINAAQATYASVDDTLPTQPTPFDAFASTTTSILGSMNSKDLDNIEATLHTWSN